MGDKDTKNGVLDHETSHVHDARTNTQQYQSDSQHTKDTKGKTPHDSRPEEQTCKSVQRQSKTRAAAVEEGARP
jgi:hypothetical protein